MPSVLIVDDHRGTLDLFSATLRNAGFETAIAATGAEGIALALAGSFDVHLIDLQLPDMTGVEVVRELRRNGVVARAVILTAFPAFSSAFDVGATGADGYVEGPLWDTQIVDVVAQALSGPLPVRRPAGHPAAADRLGQDREHALSPRVRTVKQMIDAELDKSVSVRELASRVEWSESTLSHRFHTQVGVSISEYRKEQRLHKIAELLVTTYQSIRQIAYGVGYRSLSLADFRQDFRNRFGMSAKEYRMRFWRTRSN